VLSKKKKTPENGWSGPLIFNIQRTRYSLEWGGGKFVARVNLAACTTPAWAGKKKSIFNIQNSIFNIHNSVHKDKETKGGVRALHFALEGIPLCARGSVADQVKQVLVPDGSRREN